MCVGTRNNSVEGSYVRDMTTNNCFLNYSQNRDRSFSRILELDGISYIDTPDVSPCQRHLDDTTSSFCGEWIWVAWFKQTTDAFEEQTARGYRNSSKSYSRQNACERSPGTKIGASHTTQHNRLKNKTTQRALSPSTVAASVPEITFNAATVHKNSTCFGV